MQSLMKTDFSIPKPSDLISITMTPSNGVEGNIQALKFNKTPSARLVVEYLVCRPQRVGFQVSGFDSSGSI